MSRTKRFCSGSPSSEGDVVALQVISAPGSVPSDGANHDGEVKASAKKIKDGKLIVLSVLTLLFAE